MCVSTDLYVKLYVVNIATQKRIIKKKTRVCRHDREPSFNETFRFCMNPTGHSLQVIPQLLMQCGVKKTQVLILSEPKREPKLCNTSTCFAL